ncbi:hypothetical protein, partial [Actinomadura sp. LOL_011]
HNQQPSKDFKHTTLVAACLPSLACSELARLPKPVASERERLRRIAHRAERHPRVIEIAANQLHTAVNECVKRGRLLHANHIKKMRDVEVTRLAEDLALACGSPQHLAKICGFLTQLPQPSVVAAPARTERLARWQEQEGNDPRFLLGIGDDCRVKALSRLASNPHTPCEALTGVLPHLHPVEISWLLQHANLPARLRQATAVHAPSQPDDGVTQILTDDDLDAHPSPPRVLQSWLDASRVGRRSNYYDVERAILRSRHCTDALLRQLPADLVLDSGIPETAAPLLINLCGEQPERWTALLAALDRVDDTITFGDFLDALPSAEAVKSA